MLMNKEDCALLVIDLQAALVPVIDLGETVTEHCVWLAAVAAELAVPVVISEQSPEKIGPTLHVLKAAAAAEYIGKQSFSAWEGGLLRNTAVARQRQTVVCGVEAHVCVLQTAIALRQAGKEVFVVAEAVGSRKNSDYLLALARLRDCGVQVVSREMVAFEWLQCGGTPQFREIHRRFIR